MPYLTSVLLADIFAEDWMLARVSPVTVNLAWVLFALGIVVLSLYLLWQWPRTEVP